MKVSDFIAEWIARQEIQHVFGLTGAHILHIIDSICQHPQLKFIPCLHEQGAVFAAEAYARVNGKFGVVISTSGPGAVNLLSGTVSAYVDSIPLLLITGQVVTSQLRQNVCLRQQGFQETDIISIFRPVVKWSQQLRNCNAVPPALERALFVMQEGRPGPVLLDIPDDVQRAEII